MLSVAGGWFCWMTKIADTSDRFKAKHWNYTTAIKTTNRTTSVCKPTTNIYRELFVYGLAEMSHSMLQGPLNTRTGLNDINQLYYVIVLAFVEKYTIINLLLMNCSVQSIEKQKSLVVGLTGSNCTKTKIPALFLTFHGKRSDPARNQKTNKNNVNSPLQGKLIIFHSLK